MDNSTPEVSCYPTDLSSPHVQVFKCRMTTFSLTAALQRAVASEDDRDFEADVCAGTDDDTDDDVGGGELTDDTDECLTLQRSKRKFHNLSPTNDSGGSVKRPAPQARSVGPEGAIRFATSLQPDLSAGTSKRGSGRKAHNKKHKIARRKVKQLKDFNENKGKPQASKVAEFLGAATTTSATIVLEDLPANASGYEATYQSEKEERTLDMEELLSEGYEVIEWDGRNPLILVEEETEKIFFVGVPKPDNPTYDAACDAVADLLVELGTDGSFEEGEFKHTRGEGFAAINIGTSAGHGPQDPYTLRNGRHKDIDRRLRQSPALERLALHQSASLKFYIPKLYDYYHAHTIPVRQRLAGFNPNWEKSIFSTAACNCGKRVATYFHRDCRDLVFGKCAVHAVGKYNYLKGGHIVLKEPKLIIQFPSGTHVLLPSAAITHGNIPVEDGEIRASFTQYTAGAMFRYVDNGFTTEKRLKKRNKAKYRKIQEDKALRWEMGLGLWSTIDELLKGAVAPASE